MILQRVRLQVLELARCEAIASIKAASGWGFLQLIWNAQSKAVCRSLSQKAGPKQRRLQTDSARSESASSRW
jgi:hypothetical protein